MSWTDEELDTLFKEAADKQSVPFHPEYWEEMEAMLGQKKKRRFGIWWWTTAGVILLLGGSGLFYLMNGNKELGSGEKQLIANEEIVHNDNPIEKSGQVDPELVNSLEGDSFAIISPLGSSNNKAQRSVETAHDSESSKLKVAVDSQAPNNLLIVSAENTTEKLEQNTLVADNHVAIVEVQQNDETIEENKAGSLYNPITNTDQAEISNVDVLPFKAINSFDHSEVQLAPFVVQNFDERLQLFLEAGGGLQQAYVVNTPIMSTWNFGGGVRFNWSKLSLNTGISFSTALAKDFEWNQRKTVYSFGASTINTTVSYDRLYQLNAPLSLAYKLGNRHELALGVETNYNFACRMKFTKMEDEPTALSVSKDSEQLYYVRSGKLRSLNFSPSLEYRYYLLPRISMGIKLSTLLLEPVKEPVFTNESRALPFQTNLNLRWTF